MANVNDAINGAKSLIDAKVKNEDNYILSRFDGYHQSYLFTNENIKAYLDLVDFEGKDNALSVLASGDQVFSLISKGILNIDTFDINELQPYLTLGLKRAMILKYSYLEFIEISRKLININTSLDEISSIISDLLSYMEFGDAVFWRSIIDYNYRTQKNTTTTLNLIYLLTRGTSFIGLYFQDAVTYLESEEIYNKLKNSLIEANISFKITHANNLPSEFTDKYDFILLSNILDYFTSIFGRSWKYDKLKQFESRLMPLLKQNGIIFLHYLFLNHCGTEDFIFCGSAVKANDLEDETIITFPELGTTYNTEGILVKKGR